jgi:hypothetical protein
LPGQFRCAQYTLRITPDLDGLTKNKVMSKDEERGEGEEGSSDQTWTSDIFISVIGSLFASSDWLFFRPPTF